MNSLFVAFFSLVASTFRTRAALQAEILALCHQLTVLQKNAPPRLRLQRSDRFLWSCSRDAGRVGGVVCTSFAPIRDRLAPPSVRVVLDAEITAASGKTERGRRNSRLDSEPEPSHPVVGCTPHSRGTAQVRDRSSTIDRGQISSPPAEASVPNLANLLDQSHGADGLHRFLPGADGDLPTSVCVRGVVACAAPCFALSSDRTPQPGGDDAADAGSVSLGPRVQISSARPRCDLRR